MDSRTLQDKFPARCYAQRTVSCPLYPSDSQKYRIYIPKKVEKEEEEEMRASSANIYIYIFIAYSQKSHKSPHYNRIDQILLFISEFWHTIRYSRTNQPADVLLLLFKGPFYSREKYLRYIKKKKKENHTHSTKTNKKENNLLASSSHITFCYRQTNSHLVCNW